MGSRRERVRIISYCQNCLISASSNSEKKVVMFGGGGGGVGPGLALLDRALACSLELPDWVTRRPVG